MIIIFAGAGASFAVNKNNYPTTKKFFELLGQNITDVNVFQQCIHYLHVKRQKNDPDIEDVLFYLSDLKHQINMLCDEHSIILDHLSQADQNLAIRIRDQYASQYKSKISALENRIYREIYSHYIHEPTEDELKQNWTPLMDYLIDQEDRTEIFTTNYDVVLEQLLIHYNSKVKTFPKSSTWVHPRIDIQEWQGEQLGGAYLRLTKLHGSINWTSFLDNRHIYTGYPDNIEDPNKRPIIYPGFKGEPRNEPFITFHNHFSNSIPKSKYIIFIGFAFRDEFINNILSSYLSNNHTIIVIDPNKELVLPFEHSGKVEYIHEEFVRKSIGMLKNIMQPTTS